MNTQLHVITKAEDVTDHLLVLVVNCVEDWFPPEQGAFAEDEFIDRLCVDYLNTEGFEIEQLDTPAVRKIIRHARRTQRDMS